MTTNAFLRPLALVGAAAATVLLFTPTRACASPGDLYVSLLGNGSAGSGSIVRITPAGVQSTFATGLNTPVGLAFDTQGNLFVADAISGSIFKFTPAGVKSTFATGLGPLGLAFDAQGNLYEADAESNAIFKFNPAGAQSTFATGLNRPNGLAFDARGNLYESEYGNDPTSGGTNYIIKFSPTGGRIGSFVTMTSVAFYGLAFDSQGNLFAGISGDGSPEYIAKITPAGVPSKFSSQAGGPHGLAFDTQGNLYASGELESRIYKFDAAGSYSVFANTNGFASFLAFEPEPPFFLGQAAVGNGVDYLSFPDGNYFGYYAFLADPAYLYHFDLGYEYIFNAADGQDGVYFYDFASSTFFYTSPTFPFPYLYDFTLNTVLYYYPDPKNAGHYNTDGVRYFYDFATGKIITK